MAGKDPSGMESTGNSDIFSHISLYLIGKPQPYCHGDDFYQFCDRFIQFVRLHDISAKLDLLLLSFVDNRTHAILKTVQLEDEDKSCPVKLCDAYKQAMEPGLLNGALLAQLFTLKQNINESVDNFSYRISNIAQKLRADESTINSHKFEALVQGLNSVEIKMELIRSQDISYDQAVISARKIEGILQCNSKPIPVENIQISDHINKTVCDRGTNYELEHSRSADHRSRARHRPHDHKLYFRSKMRPKYNDRSFSRERSYRNSNYKEDGRRTARQIRRCRDEDTWRPFSHKRGKKHYRTRYLPNSNAVNGRGRAYADQNNVKSSTPNKAINSCHNHHKSSNTSFRKILVAGTCEQNDAIIFVDTGSTISLVSPSFVDKIGRIHEITKDETILTSFTKNKTCTMGSIKLQIQIAGVNIDYQFHVTNFVQHDILLGMDIMSNYSLNIDNRRHVISSDYDESNFINVPKSVNKTHKISCKKTTVVQPNTICNITLKVQGKCNTERVEGIFEPYFNFIAKTGLLLKPSWCYAHRKTLQLPCINITDTPIKIYKNKVVGSYEPVYSGDNSHVHKVQHVNNNDQCNLTEPEPKSQWKNIHELYDKLKISSLPLTEDEKEQLKQLIRKYSHCFAIHPYDLGKCTIYTADIRLENDARPVWIPSRPVPYNLQKYMDQEIKSMKDSGMIGDCALSYFNSQTFLVAKKNNKYRFVQDCRSINKVSLPDKFELPNLNHILDKLTETKYLSTFDFVSSFSQIPLDEKSQHITAFSYNGSRYQFRRLVQGHKTSSSQFSRMMQKLLGKAHISNLVWFIDDLLLGSNTVIDHLKRMEHLFQRLSLANLKLSPDKSEIFQSSVKFVGMCVSSKGIAIDKDRIKAIKSLKIPSNVKDVQKVIGIFQYSRKYVRGFAAISQPLYNLLKKQTIFKWDLQCQQAFDSLKMAITTAPVLGIPNPNGQFEVTCDASAKGFGGMLQERLKDGSLKTVAYFSRTVPKHQRHWHATKLEFLAMHACLLNWRIYLQGAKKFKVFTDCKPLLQFHKIFSKGNAAMQRKLSDLAGFQMEIIHISGESNIVSDALSRYGHGPDTVNKFSQTESPEPVQVNKVVKTSKTDENSSKKFFDQLSLSLIRQEQQKDVLLTELRKWLDNGKKPTTIQEINSPKALMYYWHKFGSFAVKDDLIYYKWLGKAEIKGGPRPVRWLILVPQTLIERVIMQYHANIQSCHAGIDNSLDLCRHKFWFYNQKQEFEYYIKSCPKCNEIKQPRKYARPFLKPIIFREFNQGVAIDHIVVTKDQATARGNRYILTITCLFTGFLVACPVRTQTSSETISKFNEHWTTIFGWPMAIIHDNHKGFTSDLFSAMTTIFDIDDRHTTPYHCQSNGKVESQNKRINTALRASLTSSQIKDWDLWLKYVVFTLNSLRSSRTGYSSNFLVFGRHLRAPRELWLQQENPKPDSDPYENIDNLRKKAAYDLHRKIGIIMQKAQAATNKSVEYMTKQFNSKYANAPFFEKGQYCYVKINVPSSKFSARWTGPWKILKKISDNVYIVLVDNKESVTNVGRMKPYHHSKYFPVNQEVGTQVGKESHVPHHKPRDNIGNSSTDGPEDDDQDLILYYRPITRSTMLDEASREQLQRTIDNTTGTGRSENLPNPDAQTTPGSTGNLTPAVRNDNQPSGSNSAIIPAQGTNSANIPAQGSNSANIPAQSSNSANNPAQGANPSYTERMLRHNTRQSRIRNPPERLTYPHDHAEANKKWRKK